MNENASCAKETGENATRRRQVRFDSSTIKELDALLIKPIQTGEPRHQREDVVVMKKNSPSEPEPVKTPQAPPAQQAAERIEAGSAMAPDFPLGIAIGTTNIIVAQNNARSIRTLRQRNAFFTIPSSKIIRKSLAKEGVSFFEKNDLLYIFGSAAEEFATMHGAQIRKPIDNGLLNPHEDDSIDVIKAIINSLIKRAPRDNVPICFSIPGEPLSKSVSTVFHESVIKMHLQSLGYSPLPINEALAIVLSELGDTNFTGIGISIGGGMCNVCFSYLSVPVITYSIQKGGDYIDAMVGNAVGETAVKIRAMKENGFDLSAEPGTKIETGLHIFYDDLFATLCQSLEQVLSASDKIPRISNGLPIVLGGGSVSPKGCRERFAKAVKNITLPFRISEIRIAENPLNAAARGSLRMAIEEGAA